MKSDDSKLERLFDAIDADDPKAVGSAIADGTTHPSRPQPHQPCSTSQSSRR